MLVEEWKSGAGKQKLRNKLVKGTRREMEMEMIRDMIHEHPLTLCESNNDGQFLCPDCGDPCFGESYNCTNCGFYPERCFACGKKPSGSFYTCERCLEQPIFHKSCVDLPEEIQVTYRPGCSFNFKKESSYSKTLDCDFCEQIHRDFKYCCEGCDFQMGIGCASMLIKYHEGQGQQHVQHFEHRHPLTLFPLKVEEGGMMNCKLCNKTIDGPSYGCAPCEFYIHNSCREFPQEIKHPFHPSHSLKLDVDGEKWKYPCTACRFDIQGFRYRCKEDCTFRLHPECTSVKPNIKYKGHQHDLIVVENLSYQSQCEACGFGIRGVCFMRCVECRLDFHLQCGSITDEDGNYLKHFSHEHVLMALRDDILHKNNNVCCYGCRKGVRGPAYGCDPCRFYLHTSCAKLPRQIYHHRWHQHYLTLKTSDRSLTTKCKICGKNFNGFTYECHFCDFGLDLDCAAGHPSVSPMVYDDEWKFHDESHEMIKHFSHGHQLVLLKEAGANYCMLCYKIINGQSYGCPPCEFYIHISCAGLLPEIRHSFHARHSLTLFKPRDPKNYRCDACLFTIEGLAYKCDLCRFYLHPECICLKVNIEYEGHGHLLTLIKNMSCRCKCEACGLAVQGAFFVRCVECDLNFHVQCSSLPLPPTVLHKQHVHPLTLCTETLFAADQQYCCTACGKERNPEDVSYYCAECEYYAHVHCAFAEVQVDEREKIKHFSHKHVLFALEVGNNNIITCSACEENIHQNNLAYACDLCNFYLHKSCVELPKVRQSPFHRQALNLQYSGKYQQCNACHKHYNGFSYNCCKGSDFNLDLECSLLLPSIKLTLVHQHMLTLFNKLYVTPECSSCKFILPDELTSLDALFLCCVKCNFNCHLLCGPLPIAMKHDSHPHSLTLSSYFFIFPDEFEDDEEFCCDVCETRQDGRECVYHCQECSFVVDFECMFSQVMQFLHDKNSEELGFLKRNIRGKKVTKKCLTFKELVLSLTEEEKKSLIEMQQKIEEENGLLDIFEELKAINPLVKARITDWLLCNAVLTSMELVQKAWTDDDDIDDPEIELVNVGDYEINPKFAPILNNLLNKYKDIGASCSSLTQSMKTILLFALCLVMKCMRTTTVVNIDERSILSWWVLLKYVQSGGFRVDFALDHVKTIAGAYFLVDSSKSSPLYKFHLEIAQITIEIEKGKAEIENLKKAAQDAISAHGSERSKSEAMRLNAAMGLLGKNAATGLLDNF